MPWKLVTLALAAVLLFLLIAGRGAVPETTEKSKTLTWAVPSEIQGLDPHGVTAGEAIRAVECLYERLLRVNPSTLQTEPAAASSYTVSEDGLTYTFTLRPDGKWSNGDPVTAHDFVYGWQRMMLPDYAAEYKALLHFVDGAQDIWDARTKQLNAYAAHSKDTGGNSDTSHAEAVFGIWLDEFNRKVGVKAIDDHTLQVRLGAPCAFFDQLVAFACYSPVHTQSHQQTLGFDPNSGRIVADKTYFANPKKLVANGPYHLERWALNDRMVLEANPHYWDRQNMGNNRIVQLTITDLSLQLKQYSAGQIDWLPRLQSSSTLIADMMKQANAGLRDDVHVAPAAGVYFYRFNCRPTVNGKPNPLADPRVRRALTMTVDRQYLVDRVTRQGQRPMTTLVPQGAVRGYEPPAASGLAFDPEAAKKLLAEAGYPNGEGLEGLDFLYNTGSGHEFVGQAVLQGWRKHLGIKMSMQGRTWGELLESAKQGDFSILRAGWFGDYQDPTSWLDMFREEDGNNHGRYISKAYEQKLTDAAAEFDTAKRLALLAEAETILLEDCPILPIYQYVDIHMFKPDRVTNLPLNAWSRYALHRVSVVDQAEAQPPQGGH